MTDITFGPAQAGTNKVIAGLAGGTGSGKTMSALELGAGLVSNPARELFVIDTEHGRARHYATAYAFQYGQLIPPFTPERYQAAIEASVAAGSLCTIVDSVSHMWEGDGGAREQAYEIAQKMAKRSGEYPEKYSYMSWNEPKESITKFELYMQRCPAHLILCFRAEEKSKLVTRGGKSEIVSIGLQPIMEKGTPYECTFLAMLSQEEPGVPHWTHKALASYLQPIFQDGPKRLSREHGKRLAQWCGSAGVDDAAIKPRNITTRSMEPTEDVAPVKTAKQRAQEIAQALDDAPNMDALLKLEERLREDIARLPDIAKSRIAAIFHAKREELQKSDEPSFHDVVDEIEPGEWRKDEGRIDDPRQPELPT